VTILKILRCSREERIVFPYPFVITDGAFMVESSIYLNPFGSTDCHVLFYEKDTIYFNIFSNATKMGYLVAAFLEPNYLVSIESKKVTPMKETLLIVVGWQAILHKRA